MELSKICFVTDEYDHPAFHDTGGIGTFIKNLAYELSDKGIEVHIFSYLYGTKRERIINDNGIIIHSVSRSNYITNKCIRILRKISMSSLKRDMIIEAIHKLFFSLQLYQFALKYKIDVFEFNDFSGDSCFFLKKNVVIRCHGNAKTLHEHMNYPKYEKSIFFEEIAFKVHKNIICVSKYCKDVTASSFNLKNIPKVIYNTVKVDSIDCKNGMRNNFTNKSIYYFGSLRERKGLFVACNVINELIKNHPDLTFHLIGKNENDNWENICLKVLSSEVLKRTVYHGSMEQREAFDHLRNAHVVVFPSYGENFSLALLEVMAMGKIVITSSIPSFLEVIKNEENGFIANDESDYVKWIDFIFSKEQMDNISRNAINTVVNNFESKKAIMENIKYYDLIINKGNPKRKFY